LAYELGILDELQLNGKVQIVNFCKQRDLHQASVEGIFHALSCFTICEITENKDVAYKGSLFADIYRNKGYFLWLIGGYGYLLQNLTSIAKKENRTGDFLKRNGKYIALAGRDYGLQFVDQHFENVLNEFPFKTIADIGCGSAERLINLAKKHLNICGIGVDRNPDAVNIARASISEEGLENRIKVFEGNMENLEARPEFLEVDVMVSFFCGHDLWPQKNCLQALKNLRTVFSHAERFLLCDTYRTETLISPEIPIFTLGFEVTHSVMGQYIPSLREWMELFPQSDWKCVNCHHVEIPSSTIFDLRPETNQKI
jgi:phenylpyruvate C(3)-methyltransferase